MKVTFLTNTDLCFLGTNSRKNRHVKIWRNFIPIKLLSEPFRTSYLKVKKDPLVIETVYRRLVTQPGLTIVSSVKSLHAVFISFLVKTGHPTNMNTISNQKEGGGQLLYK